MNPFAQTSTVAIELSNTCPLAHIHTRCPLNRQCAGPFRMDSSQHLPLSIIFGVIDTLAHYNYSGSLNFHQYNEPLTDPRLLVIISRARELLPPEARLSTITNGQNLSVQLARELHEYGLDGLLITLYGSQAERDRTAGWFRENIVPLFGDKNAGVLTWGDLDDRLDNYTRPEQSGRGNCYAPLKTVTVTCSGYVGLCCMDWQRLHNLGDLRTHKLDAILSSDKVIVLYEQLSGGDRSQIDLCRRCKFRIF